MGGPEPKAENLRRLNADLPEGDSVWFVQTMQTNDPRVHRMSHPYAVFCQGADSVASDRPSSEGDLGFVTELERHRTMGELVSYPRTLTVP